MHSILFFYFEIYFEICFSSFVWWTDEDLFFFSFSFSLSQNVYIMDKAAAAKQATFPKLSVTALLRIDREKRETDGLNITVKSSTRMSASVCPSESDRLTSLKKCVVV